MASIVYKKMARVVEGTTKELKLRMRKFLGAQIFFGVLIAVCVVLVLYFNTSEVAYICIPVTMLSVGAIMFIETKKAEPTVTNDY